MNPWLLASIGLLMALVPCGIVVCRGGRFDRLVGLQLATSITVVTLITLAIGVDRPAYADTALTLALLAFPGTLAFAVTLQRWL